MVSDGERVEPWHKLHDEDYEDAVATAHGAVIGWCSAHGEPFRFTEVVTEALRRAFAQAFDHGFQTGRNDHHCTAEAEVERLTQENTRLQAEWDEARRATLNLAASVPIDVTGGGIKSREVIPELDEKALAEWERELLNQQQRKIDAERDVIEKAKAWAGVHRLLRDGLGEPLSQPSRTLLAAVDALGDSQGDTDGP
jgi:hypothetical protein